VISITNVPALRAQNAMRNASAAMQKSMERLSTGKRINSAADDPAGFAIAARMNGHILGMNAAIRNAQDGISLAQTAEGALENVQNMAQRVRELAVMAASGTYSDADRTAMNVEARQLIEQIGDTLRDSSFNGVALFDVSVGGPGTSRPIQVGVMAGNVVNLRVDPVDLAALDTASIATAAGAQAMQTVTDDFLKTVATARAGLGAVQTRLEATIDNLSTGVVNMTEAVSRIVDVDYAAETTAFVKAQILLQASTAMLAQANQSQQVILTLIRSLSS